MGAIGGIKVGFQLNLKEKGATLEEILKFMAPFMTKFVVILDII
jgi:hypothetical protein